MKKLILTALISVGCCLGIVNTPQALIIDSIDVGELDRIIAGEDVNSGDRREVDWVNTLLSTNFDKDDDFVKVANDQPGWRFLVDEATGTYAYDLSRNGGYFFLKLGELSPDHILFENNDKKDWAVFSLSQINAYYNNTQGYDETAANFGKISHIGEFGSPVPEPATMLLFGAGLVGLAAVRRRKKAS